MPREITAHALVAELRRVVADQYNGRPLFLWIGQGNDLRSLLRAEQNIAVTLDWLDVNSLAEDVIPRCARQTLRAKLRAHLQQAIDGGRRVLAVDNPYLLLRYEPAAPLAELWNGFVSSVRAAIVVIPPATPRPAALPHYVRLREDIFAPLRAEAAGCVYAASTAGGADR